MLLYYEEFILYQYNLHKILFKINVLFIHISGFYCITTCICGLLNQFKVKKLYS